MHMRLFEVMQAALGTFRYGLTVSCQEIGIYIDESLAGNRARSAIQMLREAHTHGHVVHSCGISNKKVCMECCAYDLGDEYAILCGRGRTEDGKLTDALSGIVDSLWVATDDHAGYACVALLAWGLQAHSELDLVNAMQRRLREFLLFFHGVFYEVAGALVLPASCG
ncbi:MAG: hypothetical protein ACFNZW_08480 [Coriobacteriaceae bacterium]